MIAAIGMGIIAACVFGAFAFVIWEDRTDDDA